LKEYYSSEREKEGSLQICESKGEDKNGVSSERHWRSEACSGIIMNKIINW
jgi:hypothetical protein